ncbi:hypothetical protein [Frankia gtarii]|uniref:hypothetical protein n=1 Tax=Frankia gtarii TaxID=2950102 RepID=UPI0021BE610E|nr:hypothetical protein [Frankia gtarii]
MTQDGIAGSESEQIIITTPVVDSDGIGLETLRSSDDPALAETIKWFIERCVRPVNDTGRRVDRQD